MLIPQPQNPVVLRLVPPPLAGVAETQSPPTLEILGEMEAKLSEWLHGDLPHGRASAAR